MSYYAGIDLHSNNSVVGVIDSDQRKLFGKKCANDLDRISSLLEPYKESLEGVVVESTYNWYWLVDGLQEKGFRVHLANPAAIQQYEGIKYTDDQSDAFWLARMLLMGILPTGYIYPKDQRPVRDLLRRRLMFVKHRTSWIHNFQGVFCAETGRKISVNKIKGGERSYIFDLFGYDAQKLYAQEVISVIDFLTEKIKKIEKFVVGQVKLKPEFEPLQTVSGIGKILGITIMLEVGDISRFASAGNYSSYCRCVKTEKRSNDKKKGQGNRKNGNRYLAWAYVEAANFAKRFYPEIQRYYQKKAAKTKEVVAIKAISNKLARASYFVMKNQVPYDINKQFG